jgi:hypothetical protein
VIELKYINKKTGIVWQNDNDEQVLELIKTNSDFEIYEEKILVKEEIIEEEKPKPKKKSNK